jgi:hypothetical protein
MNLPYARTFDEVYLYLDLRPCVCGATDLDERITSSVDVDGRPAERVSGHCGSCGRSRQFTFEMPAGPPDVSFEVQYGKGDEPSRLIDCGEWLGVSELYSSAAEQHLEGLGDEPDDEDLTRGYYLLTSALAALDEVIKFLPAGADEVPEGAFWSPAGRMVYENATERFGRDGLTDEREALRARVADFERRYGSSDDDTSDDDAVARG